MGDSAHTTHYTNPGKQSAPRLFLEDENFFQKSATMVPWGVQSVLNFYAPEICEKQFGSVIKIIIPLVLVQPALY
jgi:hypothetical protein